MDINDHFQTWWRSVVKMVFSNTIPKPQTFPFVGVDIDEWCGDVCTV